MAEDKFAPRTHEEYIRKAEEALDSVHRLPDNADPTFVVALMTTAQVFATLAVATKPAPVPEEEPSRHE